MAARRAAGRGRPCARRLHPEDVRDGHGQCDPDAGCLARSGKYLTREAGGSTARGDALGEAVFLPLHEYRLKRTQSWTCGGISTAWNRPAAIQRRSSVLPSSSIPMRARCRIRWGWRCARGRYQSLLAPNAATGHKSYRGRKKRPAKRTPVRIRSRRYRVPRLRWPHESRRCSHRSTFYPMLSGGCRPAVARDAHRSGTASSARRARLCRLRPTGQTPLCPGLSLPATTAPAGADPGTLFTAPSFTARRSTHKHSPKRPRNTSNAPL